MFGLKNYMEQKKREKEEKKLLELKEAEEKRLLELKAAEEEQLRKEEENKRAIQEREKLKLQVSEYTAFCDNKIIELKSTLAKNNFHGRNLLMRSSQGSPITLQSGQKLFDFGDFRCIAIDEENRKIIYLSMDKGCYSDNKEDWLNSQNLYNYKIFDFDDMVEVQVVISTEYGDEKLIQINKNMEVNNPLRYFVTELQGINIIVYTTDGSFEIQYGVKDNLSIYSNKPYAWFLDAKKQYHCIARVSDDEISLARIGLYPGKGVDPDPDVTALSDDAINNGFEITVAAMKKIFGNDIGTGISEAVVLAFLDTASTLGCFSFRRQLFSTGIQS